MERYRGREHYPIVRWNEASRHLRGGRKITDAMQGPRWQQVVLERSPDTDIRPDRVGLALRCYERCGASWLLTDEQIEKWYDEAIARGDSYFDLPPGTFV